TELSGISFKNPVGLFLPQGGSLDKSSRLRKRAGFIVAVPPTDNLIAWISSFKIRYQGEITAVEIAQDITRGFSLSYDFADILIVNPDGNGGINALDISDTVNLLDSLVNLRLCYEKYTPIYLRVSEGITHDELNTILRYCRLSGIDGVVAEGPNTVAAIRDLTDGRFPIIGSVKSQEEAARALKSGASLVELHSSVWGLKTLLGDLERGKI
ncbi:MAG: hypothetical protein J5835_02190, partial [Bacteroidales bacterium]|nr:hypothetical protein [Bacteroidales bacterium]